VLAHLRLVGFPKAHAPTTTVVRRRLLDEAATTIEAAERGRQVRARVRKMKADGLLVKKTPAAPVLDDDAGKASKRMPLPAVVLSALLALLVLLFGARFLAGSRAAPVTTCGAGRFGRAGDSLCEASCDAGSAALAAKAQAELDAAQAELAAARAAAAAAQRVQAEIDAARSAAAAAAKVKAELDAAKAAAAAAASVRSELDAAKAELDAAKAAAASAAKVQAELDAARAAAAAAAKVQAELEAAKAAAKVQAELDAAKAELDAAKAAVAQASRLQSELEAAKAASDVSAKVQAELDAAKAMADQAAKVQAELDAARAAAAASRAAQTELASAKQSAAASARLKAERDAAKMAACSAKKVASHTDKAASANAAAMRTQNELAGAKAELESARAAAAAAAKVREGLRRARAATEDELRGGSAASAAAVASELAAAQAAAGRLGAGGSRDSRDTAALLAAQLSAAKRELAAELAASPSAAPQRAATSPGRDASWLSADSVGMFAVIAVLGAYGFGLDTLWSSGSASSAASKLQQQPQSRSPSVRAGTVGSGRRSAVSPPPSVVSGLRSTPKMRSAPARASWALLRARVDAEAADGNALRTAALASLERRAGHSADNMRGAAMWRARTRSVRLLAALAGDDAVAAPTALAALDGLRRLTQADDSAYLVLSAGGLDAALRAAVNRAGSADTAWHVCTLLGNLALAAGLVPRLAAAPDVRSGRAMLLVVSALTTHASDARVVGAATGCAWTLIMALGRPCADLAVRAGVVPLLVSAVRTHRGSVVVYNACGALLTLAQGSTLVQKLLDEDNVRTIRDATDSHGGISELYGAEVARNAAWLTTPGQL
jgi:hypothetical protein